MILAYIVALTALAALPQPGAESLDLGDIRFIIDAVIPTPQAPHGASFSPDGKLAYIACAGDDKIITIDLQTNEIVQQFDAPGTPLDAVLIDEGRSLLFSQFIKNTLAKIDLSTGKLTHAADIAQAPSLFSRLGKHEARYIVCENADTVVEIDNQGQPARQWDTGDRPYPADLTSDGILLFVPNRDGNSVTVIDTLNNRIVATVDVADGPQGGAVTDTDTHYLVANGGADAITYINTASFEVTDTITENVGPRPFSITTTSNPRYAIINNAGGDTISILDVNARKIVGSLQVGGIPIVVRAHPDGQRFLVMCEGDHHVAIVRMHSNPKPTPQLKEVIVLGMIHSGHTTSERYSLEILRDLIRAIDPTDVLVEIPPNRFDAAMAQWIENQQIVEPRASRFPEYVDVLFPLLDEMSFTIVPTAGWTAEMNTYRNAQLRAIQADPNRTAQWQTHEVALANMQEMIDAIGPSDDPRVLHSQEYDMAIAAGYAGPYNTFFNDDLADGGWDNINTKHYAHIERFLNNAPPMKIGYRRVLITYGAAHKGWFLDHLKQRDDVKLLDVNDFLDALDND